MFDVEVAKQVGIIAAILFQNIAFWCQHSQANGTNFHDGNFWTYNTVKAFRTMFPYLSTSQIDTGLKRLVDSGFIIKGNYNKSAYDRTTWYAITEFGKSIFEKSKMENQIIENGFPENREPIPDINTDVNTDSKPDKSISRLRDKTVVSPGFESFWKVYPRHVAKQNAVKAWTKTGADDSQALTDSIITDVKQRLDGEWSGKDMQYIPHPSTYLNQRRWEDETEVTKVAEHREPDPVILTDEEQRIIDEIYANGGGWG